MNDKIKQLNRSIKTIEDQIARIEESFSISFTMRKAIELRDLRSDLRVLNLKKEAELKREKKVSQRSSIDEFGRLLTSVNPYNLN